MMNVLFEDNHCIAVVKPAGAPVQSDRSGDPSFLEEVRQFLKDKYQKPGDAFVGLVHRLDRPVGGVMVFAKTSKGASRLSEQFRDHRVQKTYWAAVEGSPEHETGTVTQWLVKDENENRVTAFEKEVPGAKKAELVYRVLERRGDYALVEIKPLTGRSHQIRSAMAKLGCPIVGDLKYGSREPLGASIALFAVELKFHKPVGDEEVVVSARPDWSLWR